MNEHQTLGITLTHNELNSQARVAHYYAIAEPVSS